MDKTIDPEAGSRLQDLIDLNQDLYYEEEVFTKSCQDIGQGSESDFWAKNLGSISGPADIANAVPEDLREHFFKLYIARFRRGLAV